MNYRILIVRNKGLLDISSKVAALKTWVSTKTPTTPIIDFLDVDVPLKWKPFTHIQGKNYVGLDGIKEALEKRTDIVYGFYQAIIFAYDTSDYIARNDVLCCWTYPNSYLGSPFIEVFYDRALLGSNMFYFMAHELVHAMHRRLWTQNIWTIDDMDLYDGNTDPHQGANYNRNLMRIAPYWNKVAEDPSWLTLLRLKQMYALLVEKLSSKKK